MRIHNKKNLYIYFFIILVVENNTTVNNLDQNELTFDHSNNNSMISIDKQQNLLSPTFQTGHNERTISSSSSEQLIPREKQTGN